jgi:hypothetical protein
MITRIAVLALVCVGVSDLAIAQAQTTPSGTTPPSQSTPKEAPTTGNSASQPSSASSPHQRQVTGKANDQVMKDCIAKQRAANTSLSKDAAKQACKTQMKSSPQP